MGVQVTGADLNGDGYADLVAASGEDGTVRWFPNVQGTGQFGDILVTDQGKTDNAFAHISISDFDSDGLQDILFASSNSVDGFVAAFLNSGRGDDSAFTAMTSVSVPNCASVEGGCALCRGLLCGVVDRAAQPSVVCVCLCVCVCVFCSG